MLVASGCSSVVERQLPKLKVASSTLVTRSNKIKDLSEFIVLDKLFRCLVL